MRPTHNNPNPDAGLRLEAARARAEYDQERQELRRRTAEAGPPLAVGEVMQRALLLKPGRSNRPWPPKPKAPELPVTLPEDLPPGEPLTLWPGYALPPLLQGETFSEYLLRTARELAVWRKGLRRYPRDVDRLLAPPRFIVAPTSGYGIGRTGMPAYGNSAQFGISFAVLDAGPSCGFRRVDEFEPRKNSPNVWEGWLALALATELNARDLDRGPMRPL